MLLSAALLFLSLLGHIHGSDSLQAPRRHLGRRQFGSAYQYPTHTIKMPVDHFHNESRYEPHNSSFFDNQYWFDATYYRPGGPVIVQQIGEGPYFLYEAYLKDGLLAELAKATNGLSVLLEARYFGYSFPLLTNLSTDNLRFCSVEQIVADQAYFAQNVQFPGLETMNLTAPHTPYIAVGGSLAGALVSILRKGYPDVYWGAISSSGITGAQIDYWQYFDTIRQYGPTQCMAMQQKIISVVDKILLSKKSGLISDLKSAYGMETLTHNDDFAAVLAQPLYGFQGRAWTGEAGYDGIGGYCSDITSQELRYTNITANKTSAVKALIQEAGRGSELGTLLTPMLNHIGSIYTNQVEACFGAGRDNSLDVCWGTHNPKSSEYSIKLENSPYLAYEYIVCNELGLFETSGAPKGVLPIVSQLMTVDYLSLPCKLAFNQTSLPDINRINQWGGLNFSYPRLAITGGTDDPWRQATPLADDAVDQLHLKSTASEPKILIQGGVHQWDLDGVLANETNATYPPPAVQQAHLTEIAFVKEWLEDWNANH